MLTLCQSCNNLFESSVFSIANADVKISNVHTIEPCPYCGDNGIKLMLDGNFKCDENGITTLLSGPQFTKDILLKFKLLAEKADAATFNPEEFAINAGKIHPLLRHIFEFLSHKYALTGYAIVAMLYPILKDLVESGPPVQNNYYFNVPSTVLNSFHAPFEMKQQPIVSKNANPIKNGAAKGTNRTPAKKRRKKRS